MQNVNNVSNFWLQSKQYIKLNIMNEYLMSASFRARNKALRDFYLSLFLLSIVFCMYNEISVERHKKSTDFFFYFSLV